MFPSDRVFSVVGIYGGPVCIIVLIYAVIVLRLSRMRGTLDEQNARFRTLAHSSFAFCLIALGGTLYVRFISWTPNRIETVNQTSGNLSPVAPNNSGSITITNQKAAEDKKGNP